MRRALLLLVFALPAAAQPVPPPQPDEALLVWCKRVFTGRAVVPLKCEESLDALDPGRPSATRVVTLPGGSFQRAWNLAVPLFGIPAGFAIPAKGPAVQTLQDPAKAAHLWTSTLTIRRDKGGQVESAEYQRRQEGSGTVVSVTRQGTRFVLRARDSAD